MSLPQWRGLWDYTMRNYDGTHASTFRPEDLDPEKMKWWVAAWGWVGVGRVPCHHQPCHVPSQRVNAGGCVAVWRCALALSDVMRAWNELHNG